MASLAELYSLIKQTKEKQGEEEFHRISNLNVNLQLILFLLLFNELHPIAVRGRMPEKKERKLILKIPFIHFENVSNENIFLIQNFNFPYVYILHIMDFLMTNLIKNMRNCCLPNRRKKLKSFLVYLFSLMALCKHILFAI